MIAENDTGNPQYQNTQDRDYPYFYFFKRRSPHNFPLFLAVVDYWGRFFFPFEMGIIFDSV